MSASSSISRLRRIRRAARPRSSRRVEGAERQSEARRDAMKATDSVFARVAFITEADYAARRPPWRRFPLAGAGSGLALFLLLLGFAYVLKPRVVALPPTSAVEARLVEVIPPKPAEPEKIAPSAPAKIAPQMRPKRTVHHAPPPKPKPQSAVPPPPAPESASPYGGVAYTPAPAAPSGHEGTEGSAGESGGEGAAVGGSDSGGARAIYAPLPAIPDELRENAFSAVAVAHFVVAPDGKVEVTLTTPTPDSKLNQLILETLHEWKFFPAIKDGVAIASQFDVRIPISVQ